MKNGLQRLRIIYWELSVERGKMYQGLLITLENFEKEERTTIRLMLNQILGDYYRIEYFPHHYNVYEDVLIGGSNKRLNAESSFLLHIAETHQFFLEKLHEPLLDRNNLVVTENYFEAAYLKGEDLPIKLPKNLEAALYAVEKKKSDLVLIKSHANQQNTRASSMVRRRNVNRNAYMMKNLDKAELLNYLTMMFETVKSQQEIEAQRMYD